jgi:hypothetical protein
VRDRNGSDENLVIPVLNVIMIFSINIYLEEIVCDCRGSRNRNRTGI